ncbi:MAG: ABC transporter permease [Candidatus Helarchaeota archaeon]|nr:ABC transporter permease [Candidatus Helarchaeota archaeon]
MGYLSELWAVFWRGLIALWRNKILLIGNLIMPFAMIFFMAPAADTSGFSFEYLATGMMCMMIFFSGMFIPNNIIWDRDSKFLNILFVSPAHRSTIILGYSLVGAVRSTIQVSIIYLGAVGLSAAMGYEIYFSGGDFCLLILLTILTTILVGGFMTIIASYSKNSETFFLLSGMIGLPLMLMSNIFFEPTSFPIDLSGFGRFNPLNHLANTVRYLMFGDEVPGSTPIATLPAGVSPWEGPLIIILLAIVFTILGTYVFVRTVKK